MLKEPFEVGFKTAKELVLRGKDEFGQKIPLSQGQGFVIHRIAPSSLHN